MPLLARDGPASVAVRAVRVPARQSDLPRPPAHPESAFCDQLMQSTGAGMLTWGAGGGWGVGGSPGRPAAAGPRNRANTCPAAAEARHRHPPPRRCRRTPYRPACHHLQQAQIGIKTAQTFLETLTAGSGGGGRRWVCPPCLPTPLCLTLCSPTLCSAREAAATREGGVLCCHRRAGSPQQAAA